MPTLRKATLAAVPAGPAPDARGIHVAIIMDGNGRWATARGLPRTAGHKRGAQAARAIIEAAAETHIETLTLFALSTQNFSRPPMEVARILALLRRYAIDFASDARRNELRLEFIGSRARLPAPVVRAMQAAEASSARDARRTLRIAVDYSAQAAIQTAASMDPSLCFHARINAAIHSRESTPPVDLLIRTGGDQRLSDFMLWEAAWAELYFTETLWPDFSAEELNSALANFSGRERRFGQVLAV